VDRLRHQIDEEFPEAILIEKASKETLYRELRRRHGRTPPSRCPVTEVRNGAGHVGAVALSLRRTVSPSLRRVVNMNASKRKLGSERRSISGIRGSLWNNLVSTVLAKEKRRSIGKEKAANETLQGRELLGSQFGNHLAQRNVPVWNMICISAAFQC
jgi:hypothetical protein